MIKRLALRTAIFAALTLIAFAAMKPLTVLSGWPEVMQGLSAAAWVAWAEISIMWVRIGISPKLDMQVMAIRVEKGTDYKAMSTVYLAYTITWAIRIGAFLYLARA